MAPPVLSVWREFWHQQAPVIAALLAAACAAAYFQHGFLPGADRAFPLAGVRVPIWHLVWMGAWTGYTMALVGEASGIFALPYSMSILQFGSAHVTPTTQVLTFLNPIGALLGFRRSGQWNLDFAKWVCIGGALGGLIGPFLRLTVFAEPKPFKFLVGMMLAFVGVHLLHESLTRTRAPAPGLSGGGTEPARVETIEKTGGRTVIAYFGGRWSLSNAALFITGAGVGVIASALGVGGGFLLVPIFAAFFRLPMYVLVAATIPFVIVLSAVGLLTYVVVMPVVASVAIQPEWAWGLFAAAGGSFGSWCAAKTQRWVPEHLLKLMLGGVTAVAGALYVVNFFVPLPFHL
ncbi:MAG: sulfite exporter TauE/SafE family protein [Burkholderiales bacterium]